MGSKTDIIIGLLVLIAGVVMYPGPIGTMYVGGVLAIIFGIIGLALHKRISGIVLGVSILAIIFGITIILIAPGPHLYPILQSRDLAMEVISGLTIVIGIIGIITGAIVKPKRT